MRALGRIVGKDKVLAGLRADMGRAQGRSGEAKAHETAPPTFSLVSGLELPSLEKAALHEVRGTSHPGRPAATGFLMALLARLQLSKNASGLVDTRPILWCEQGASALDFGMLYGPGLKAFGLEPERFIVARAGNAAELLWAMEEGVRSGALMGVVGAFGPKADLGLTASRRLQLAAERTGTTAFLLRQPADSLASVARTRWVIGSRPSSFYVGKTIIGLPRWQVRLDKCRGGRPGTWDMEWDYAAHRFCLVSALADRPVLPEHRADFENAGDNVRTLDRRLAG